MACGPRLNPVQICELQKLEASVLLTERDAGRLPVIDEQVLGQSRGYQMFLLVTEFEED